MEVIRITESPITSEVMSEVNSLYAKSSSSEQTTTLGNDNIPDSIFMSSCENEVNEMKLMEVSRDLCPITPSPDGEAVELSKSLSDCETPTGSIFDPFAAGPEELAAFAPKKNMMSREIKVPIRRQLNFDIYCENEENIDSSMPDEEDFILEMVCKSFLELVISNQVKEMNEKSGGGDVESDGCKTPTSMPLLTGIAETCPLAPKRPVPKSRRLDQSIVRKLDFGSCLI